MKYSTLCVVALSILSSSAALPQEAPPRVTPAGEGESAEMAMLETGAKMLQENAPPAQLDVYLVGFHPMKAEPEHQMEAHHYCKQVNKDFTQCALFDGNTADANLNGIEYIISEKVFEQLPQEERQFWHPHNFEILSGQLVGPGLPDVAEKELMQSKLNSYGKTWHVWNTGHFGLEDAERMPMGEPKLAWSFNHVGEARPGLVENMERRVGVNTEETRSARQDLVELAEPQEGVNALAGRFERETEPLPGVAPKE